MSYRIVDRENASGLLAGIDFGSSVRVLARSPDRVVFSSGGLHGFADRTNKKAHNSAWVSLGGDGRVSAKMIRDCSGKIDEFLGKGAAEIVLEAWSKKRTALIDGGGEPLALPRQVQAQQYEARRAALTCTMKIDLTGEIATCPQCGGNLQPDCDRHHMGPSLLPNHPRTIEDCQKLSNTRVISLTGYQHEGKWEFVDWFECWDGVSTVQDTFCSNKCAAIYGRRAFQELSPLPVGGEPVQKERAETISKNHYKERDPIRTASGLLL